MSGTKAGGLAAAKTNKLKYGEGFYRNIGSRGGSVKGVKKGFAANPEMARRAGALGGRASKRRPVEQVAIKRKTSILDRVREAIHHGQ